MHVTAAPRRADLARELADELDATFTAYEVSSFPDGEFKIRVPDGLDDRTVLLGDLRPNERILETLIAADAVRQAGAEERILAVPYLAFARQDRAFEPGEGVSARAINQALGTAGEALCTVDVHAKRVLDAFPHEAVDVKAIPELAGALDGRDVDLVLAPDEGAKQQAAGVADHLEVPFDYLQKTRVSSTEVSMEPTEKAVDGSTVAIVDDIISTGGTMATATEHLLEAGAERVIVAATHGVFASGADKRLDDAGVEAIIVTDAIRSERSAVSCASALARGVRRLLPG